MKRGPADRAGRSAVTDPGDANAAYAGAVRRLARQPQPRAILEQRLRREGYTEAAVRTALDRVQALGYLDDRSYAAALVRRRSRSRGSGLIARELRAKGIGPEAAEAALAPLPPEADRETALELARRLLLRRPPPDRRGLFATVGPWLSRRGFSGSLAHQVCAQLCDEWQAAGRFDTLRELD